MKTSNCRAHSLLAGLHGKLAVVVSHTCRYTDDMTSCSPSVKNSVGQDSVESGHTTHRHSSHDVCV